jgi:hypothetical protein
MSGTKSPTSVMGPFGSKDRFKFLKIYRYFDCELYDSCLDTAANSNWKVFTCEGCMLAKCLVLIDKGEE